MSVSRHLSGSLPWGLPRRESPGEAVTVPRLLTAVFVVCFCATVAVAGPMGTPTPVILDTDLSSDVDDAGAVAVLHALADRGDIRILAAMVSSGDPWSGRCLGSMNAFFGRPDIPIGMVTGRSVVHRSTYTRTVAEEFPRKEGSAGTESDAVSLYRKVLSSSADRSVVIVSVGYLTNLVRLMRSPADRDSRLDGRALIERKVQRLVCMGGAYPEGREWNFYQDAEAARTVVNDWPGPVTFVGFEAGVTVLTGSGLKASPADHPVRRSYQLYNGLSDRPSWDQLAVLVAALDRGTAADLWHFVNGRNRVSADGSNHWVADPSGRQAYLVLDQPPGALAGIIEKLMTTPPSTGAAQR